MNPQELFIDVSSGRFLDGQSAIPASSPKIYSDELKRFRIGLYKVKSGVVSVVTPSDNSTFKARLGTTSLKLADGISISTAQPNLITAVGSVVTASSLQAIGNARITTYSPVTATLIANVTTFPIVTAGFSASVNYIAPVTASITVGIGSITMPGSTVAVPVNLSGITDLIKPTIFGRVLTLTATLNTPQQATFAAVISGGSVTTIARVSDGLGYLNGTYSLSFSSPNPSAATFSATISGGVVTNISIVTGGRGYGQGPFDLVFGATTGTIAAATASSFNGSINSVTIIDGGTGYSSTPNVSLATPSSVTASATVVVSQDQIQSITLISGGSGYSAIPTVTLFTPAKRIIAVEPSNKTSNVVSGSTFNWAYGLASSATVGLLFSSPDNISTPIPTSVPSAFIYYQGGNTWKLQLISSGYGYTTAPSVIHNDVLVSDNYLNFQAEIVPAVTPLSDEFYKLTVASQPALISAHPRSQVKSSARKAVAYSTVKRIKANIRQVQNGIYISSGGLALDYSSKLSGILDNENIYGVFGRRQQYFLPETYFDYKVSISPFRDFEGKTVTIQTPQLVRIFSIANDLNLAEARLLKSSGNSQILPNSTNPFQVLSPINLNHAAFADKDFLAVLVPEASEQPTRYALCRIIIPATGNYEFLQNGDANESGANYDNGWTSQPGGGALEPKIIWLDYGAGYTSQMCSGGFKLREVGGLLSGNDFIESPGERSVTAVTSFLTGGYANNFLARSASASTRPGARGVKYFLSDGGFGYYKSSVISISPVAISGGVITASIVNSPTNYINGTYACSVATVPGVGTTAQISLVVSNGIYNAVIVNPGFGYATSPTITAPDPNFISGSIANIVVATRPEGYSLNTVHNINISQSPVSGGTAEANFTIGQNKQISVNIVNPGYGYITSPTAVGNDPDLRSQNGYISSIQLSNQPVGYVVGRNYQLTVQQSPSAYGTANAILVRTDSSKYDIRIVSRGYGYTSAPTVVAVGPDQPQGTVNYVSVITRGRGYSPGTYQCSVSSAPIGGETAEISFVVVDNKNASFITNNPGYGYTSTPLVSVPTPNGNVLSSISITCAGSYYTPSTATFSILDDSGSGATFKPVVSSGTINAVQVVDGGYGYTNNPAMLFSSPVATTFSDLSANQIEADFNITTASANAILTTSTQRDILMEVYETDGTSEQVIAQATVNLTKRVLE